MYRGKRRKKKREGGRKRKGRKGGRKKNGDGNRERRGRKGRKKGIQKQTLVITMKLQIEKRNAQEQMHPPSLAQPCRIHAINTH